MHKLNAQLRPGEKLIVVAYSGGCGEGTAARARVPHLASEAHLFDPIGVKLEVDMITRNNPAVKSFVYRIALSQTPRKILEGIIRVMMANCYL